jgi:hypothetical protein
VRRILSGAAAVFALLISALVFAPSASAAGYGCSGNLINTYDVKTSAGTKYGQINLYYSTADGGTNCAVVVDTYWGSNVVKSFYIGIQRCPAGTTAGTYCTGTVIPDSGHYYSYAGPVSVTSTADRCVRIYATETNPSFTVTASKDTAAVHC